jgi:hypothetical protein
MRLHGAVGVALLLLSLVWITARALGSTARAVAAVGADVGSRGGVVLGQEDLALQLRGLSQP